MRCEMGRVEPAFWVWRLWSDATAAAIVLGLLAVAVVLASLLYFAASAKDDEG